MVPKEFRTKLPLAVELNVCVKVSGVKLGVKLTVDPGPPADVALLGRPGEEVEVLKVPLLPVMLA
jgi:hypothetical protein